jgi:hypothetical protein
MIAPKVVIDGQDNGWMWILSFAIKGCQWAINEATKPEFEVKVRKWFFDKQIEALEEEREILEKQLCAVEAKISELRRESE